MQCKELDFLTFSDLILMFLIASDICSNNSDFAVICDILFASLKRGAGRHCSEVAVQSGKISSLESSPSQSSLTATLQTGRQ